MTYIGGMSKPQGLSVKKLIAISPELANAIAAYRFDARIPSESEAIRRLIEAGLASAKASPED